MPGRVRPVLGQFSLKSAGAKGVWVRVGSWRGSDREHRQVPASEARPSCGAAKGKKSPQKLGLVIIPKRVFCASKEVLVKALKEYARRCCWIMLWGK
jgi:hypothetical protein